jgi:colanic acid/amylovoran biosynthesis glycosyltransferase
MPAAPPVSFLVSRFPNPSETFIQAQAEGLMERDCAVEIVALAPGDAVVLGALRLKWENKLTVRYVPLPKTLGARLAAAPKAFFDKRALPAFFDNGRFGEDASSLRLLIAASRWPKEPVRPRVWVAHYGRWGRFACALRDLGLIAGPIATVFHGKDMSAYLKKHPDAYASLFPRGDLFLPISDLWRNKLISLGAPEAKTVVHRMGVDTARFTYAPRTLKEGEPMRFIGVGRMVEKKGFDDAIRAFANFRRELEGPNATLTLIGDGEMRDYLQNFALSLNISHVVRFAGLLLHAEVARQLSEAHAFVLPSKTAASGDMEGIPVALMEAMAQGLPVLATRHSGTPELVEHDVNGLLCKEGDWRALAVNMKALASAPERWAAMGEAGAARVREEFDLKLWNDRLLQRLMALRAQAVTSAPEHAKAPP